MLYHCLPAREVAHVRVLLRLLGQMLGLKRLKSHLKTDGIVRSELREEYDNVGKAEFLSTSKYHDRTPGLFKADFQPLPDQCH